MRLIVSRLAAIGFLVVVGFGLWQGDRLSEVRWLAMLGVGWLLLIVAVRPIVAVPRWTSSHAIVQTSVLLATVFAMLAIQLLRLQVVDQAAIINRVAADPATGDVIGNPRLLTGDLRTNRGRVFDRHGELLVGTRVTDGLGRREYYDPATAYVVGYFSPLAYGKSGLEARFDAELRGTARVDPWQRIEQELLHRRPEGLDLHLTIDAELQRLAHELLDDRAGAVVVLDTKTGAVITLASNPHFNPNPLVTTGEGDRAGAVEYWATLTADPNRPLVLRATLGLYTPGSTFKTVTAAAAIEAGIAGPDDLFEDDGLINVDGHVIVEANRPDDSVTLWTLRQGLAYSLNVVFARVGLAMGGDELAKYAQRFGFGEPIPFDLPVARSQVASSDDFLRSNPAVADTAFGQGELLATPLHMAMVAAAIANEGRMMRPYLVDRITTADGDIRDRTKPRVWRQPVSAATARQVAEMMVDAVDNGYATGAAIEGIVVGGKTGTAETGQGAPHAWFIGFAGDPEPRYAVAVVLEHGGTGLAGPVAIAREMLAAAMARSE